MEVVIVIGLLYCIHILVVVSRLFSLLSLNAVCPAAGTSLIHACILFVYSSRKNVDTRFLLTMGVVNSYD